MKNSVVLVSHPLIGHSLTILRQMETQTDTFRRHANIVSQVLLMEATKHLKTNPIDIVTPLAPTHGKQLDSGVVVIPVLRAGLAMLFAIQEVLPFAAVGFMGLERDEKTAIARSYYQKLPKILSDSQILVLDPMLATGGSFDDTVTEIKKKGGHHIRLVCIVAAPEGITRIEEKHPDVTIYTAAIDDRLNDKKYIVPGLGDFGDRYFGTV